MAVHAHSRQNDVDKISALECANNILTEEMLMDLDLRVSQESLEHMLDDIEVQLVKSNTTVEIADKAAFL